MQPEDLVWPAARQWIYRQTSVPCSLTTALIMAAGGQLAPTRALHFSCLREACTALAAVAAAYPPLESRLAAGSAQRPGWQNPKREAQALIRRGQLGIQGQLKMVDVALARQPAGGGAKQAPARSAADAEAAAAALMQVSTRTFALTFTVTVQSEI